MSSAMFTRIPQRLHMLGVGGMGMAPLAIYLTQAGFTVSGSDDTLLPEVGRLLSAAGVQLTQGNDLAEGVECVVRSSAVKPQHPLCREADKRGIPLCLRGAMLARVLQGRKLVAVVGSHGKTTTCGMLITMLDNAGFKFGYLLGGLFNDPARPPARCQPDSEWVVAEIDESDGTIDHFEPELTLVVNLDWDHADRYTSDAALRETFSRLLGRTRSGIWVPTLEDDYGNLCPQASAYGATGDDFNADNERAAKAVCTQLAGALPKEPLAGFSGIRRRQDVLWDSDCIRILADYAHHPTEIRSLLKLQKARGKGNIAVVFQPHRYSRTRQFARQFASELAMADQVWLLPVYSAGEDSVAGGESDAIAAHGDGSMRLICREELLARLNESVFGPQPPQTLLFIGAGDIDRMAAQWLADVGPFLNLCGSLHPQTRLHFREPLRGRTTLRVGGAARCLAEPANDDDLTSLLRVAHDAGMPVFPLGRGSNLIVDDAGFAGLMVAFTHPFWRSIDFLGDGSIRAGAGVRLKHLCAQAAARGLSGFEFLEGIPGTVGGALRMNAGAMGGWIFDVVQSVEFMDADGQRQCWPRGRFDVGYRLCRDLQNGFALAATFQAGAPVAADEVRAKVDAYASARRESQPREPSAGCIFKNPQGTYAGKVIEELGLKGARMGGAEVSQVHGNFIINRGQATSADVIALIRKIRAEAKRQCNVELEPEVLLVGKKWEEVL